MSESKKEQLEAAFEAAIEEDSYCVLGKLIRSHEYGKIIEAKVADKRYSSPTITKVLRSVLSVEMGKETVQRHRNGGCKCADRESA